VTSNSEPENVPVLAALEEIKVLEEIEGMNSWMSQELMGLAGIERSSITYEVCTGCAACSTDSSGSPHRWGWPALKLWCRSC
jgi:hypothetical protein